MIKGKKQKTEYEIFKSISSSRMYEFSQSDVTNKFIHTLQDILSNSISNDSEWAHSLMEQLDKILDLKLMESMFYYPDRDSDSIYKPHGIIKRIR